MKGCFSDILNSLTDYVLQTLARSAALKAVDKAAGTKDATVGVFRLHLQHACRCRSIIIRMVVVQRYLFDVWLNNVQLLLKLDI